MNDLNSSQPLQQLQFENILRDFELRENIEKPITSNSTQQSEIKSELKSQNKEVKLSELNNINDIDNMIRTLPFMNDNIRTNIKLGIEIYKQLNNFDRNYIHKVINEKSKNSN